MEYLVVSSSETIMHIEVFVTRESRQHKAFKEDLRLRENLSFKGLFGY